MRKLQGNVVNLILIGSRRNKTIDQTKEWEKTKIPYKKDFIKHKQLYFMIMPYAVLFCLFVIVPIIAAFALSFTSYNMFQIPRFIGMKNYTSLFVDDSVFLIALKNTFIFALFTGPISYFLCFILAWLINDLPKSLRVIMTVVFYAPSLSSSTYFIWKYIFSGDAYGVINSFLGLFGIETSFAWLGNEKTAIWTLILLAVWQFGSSMLIFLSSLKQIPNALYEAAHVDGASKTYQFFKITLPLLTPTIFFNLVMQMIQGFLAFTQCYIITQGKPMDSTLFYTVYMYQQSFEFKNTGYGAALAWIMLIIISLITFVLFATKRFWVYDDGV